MDRIRIASDGLRARINGDWADEKLNFLDRFVPPGLTIAKRKLDRVYVDLFAGPGRNIVPETGREIEGSAIRVVQMRGAGRDGPPFTHAHVVTYTALDRDALTQRIDAVYRQNLGLIPRASVSLYDGDANTWLQPIMKRIHHRAYVFVFADIMAPQQWPWTSVQALKSQGHESVDLYLLFPLGMGINRLVSINNDAHTERNAAKLNAFYGTDEWRQFCRNRTTESQSRDVRREMLELYLRRLRELWPYAGVMKDVRTNAGQRLYKMLFATKDDAANRVADYLRQGGRGDAQGSLF